MFPEGDGTVAPVLGTDSATGDQQQQGQAQQQLEAQPTGQASPQPGDSPPQGQTPTEATPTGDAKRVADAQARMHAATEEAARLKESNAELRGRLDALFQDPRLAPVEVARPGDADMAALFKEYSEKQGDAEGFGYLLTKARELATSDMQTELQRRQAQAVNQQRARQRTEIVTTLIGERAAALAPDVPPKLFWAMTHAAEAETPAYLVHPVERLEWQMVRAIQLSREQIDPRVTAAATNATTQAAALRTANAVMPGSSGTGRSGGLPGRGDSTPVPTMVEQIRAAQDRRVT